MSEAASDEVFIPASPGFLLLRVRKIDVHESMTPNDVLDLIQESPILQWPVSDFPKTKGRAAAIRKWSAGDYSDKELVRWGERCLAPRLAHWGDFLARWDAEYCEAIQFPDEHVEPNQWDWYRNHWQHERRPSHWIWDRRAFAEDVLLRIMQQRENDEYKRQREIDELLGDLL